MADWVRAEGGREGGREGGLMKGTSEEGTGRCMDGGRDEESGGGIERAREQEREIPREVSCGGHWPAYSIFTNHPTMRPLPLIVCYYK